MPSSDAKFTELQKLLDSKDGDFKRHYKIQSADTLTAYDLLNSPRVESYLQSRKEACAALVPGKLDSAGTKKRLDMAREIARNKEIQNKYGDFTGVAMEALDVAEAILIDGRKCRAYVEWLKNQSADEEEEEDNSEVEAERALRLEEERKRKQLERQLEKANKRAREAELERQRLEREAALREEDEEEEEKPASTPGWADVFAKILEKAASRRGEAVAPAPTPQAISISGPWNSADGFHYEFYQSGSAVRMVVKQFAWGPVVTDGKGTISGGVISISFQAMTPMGLTYGQVQAQVSADGRGIQGYYQNYNLGIRGAITLYR
jgi:hypothetical protein